MRYHTDKWKTTDSEGQIRSELITTFAAHLFPTTNQDAFTPSMTIPCLLNARRSSHCLVCIL